MTKSETEKSITANTKPIREYQKHHENLRSILQYSNASMIRGKDSDGYSCTFCPQRFPQPKGLKTHFLKDHYDIQKIKLPKFTDCLLKLDITGLKCYLCFKIFDKLNLFIEHLSNHGITINKDVKNEIIPFKFDSEILKCAVCDATFTTFKILQEHMNVHFSNYFCDICKSGFINKRRLVGHKRSHRTGTFKCGYCEKIFTCDSKRRDHEQRIHLGFKRNKCKICDEKFADYWTKVDHMVKKHNQPRVMLKCQACERSFKNKRALTRHVNKDHLLERRHVCSVCDMRFYLKHRLKDHMLVHSGEKKFQCNVCSRWFATKNSVRQHLRSHVVRKYACNTCGRSFLQQSTLKNHIKIKHGNK